MISADWHPDDDRLLSQYLEPSVGDDTLDRHLTWCAACDARVRALARDLEALRAGLVDQADAEFDADRLASQRRRVLVRLGAVTPGRILAFPEPRPAASTRPWRRIAAAVLLLAVTGAGAARFVIVQDRGLSRRIVTARRTVPLPSAARDGRMRPAVFEESVFSDIDLALARPRTAELRALDDFTPVHETRVSRR